MGALCRYPLNPHNRIVLAVPFGFSARISGDYKRTPLFSTDTGAPVADPKVLSLSERAVLNAL